MKNNKTYLSKNVCYILEKKLEKIGVILDVNSIKRHSTQGLMNQVFSADSNFGELIIHIIFSCQEQRKQKVSQKIISLSKLLSKYENIPTAGIFQIGNLPEKRYYIIQKRIKGAIIGERKIIKNKIVDEYFFKNTESILKQLNKILCDLHKIRFKKYGWLKIKNNNFEGTFDSWEKFLRFESRLWLKNLRKNFLTKKEYDFIEEKLEIFFERYSSHYFKFSKSVLIHGDMINPGNILVKNGKITGIIDFEWALSGDPAWEFAFSGNKYLKHYLKICRKSYEEVVFRKKIELYRVLWLLWGTNVHAKGGKLRKILFKEFIKNLDNLIK